MVRYCLKCKRKNTGGGDRCEFCSHSFSQSQPTHQKEPMQIDVEEIPVLEEEVHEMANLIERLAFTQKDNETEKEKESVHGYRLKDLLGRT